MLQLAAQDDFRYIDKLSDYLEEQLLLLMPIKRVVIFQVELYNLHGYQSLLNLGDLVVLAQGHNDIHIKSDLSRPFRREILYRAAFRAIWMALQAALSSLKDIRQPDLFRVSAALMLAFCQEISYLRTGAMPS
jgi:hypothetical protein